MRNRLVGTYPPAPGWCPIAMRWRIASLAVNMLRSRPSGANKPMPHGVGVALTGDDLDDPAGEHESGVVVGEVLPRLEQLPLVLEPVDEVRDRLVAFAHSARKIAASIPDVCVTRWRTTRASATPGSPSTRSGR